MANTVDGTDLDQLIRLDLDHVITSVKVCTDRQAKQIVGLQIFYGKTDVDSGELVSPVTMGAFGNVNDAMGICSVTYIPDKDYINKLIY
mmetsp:Transcript_32048/g.42478  ORF Transcript_32048/g.42478 Transcript_32048/m.42478 type:complete len:89 (+) Transcript_32048:100-366(+)|eukprot:CAMPEP_0170469524 /NCGR_PEP_ID=MMETSP0123-20130129/12322_1 /TAXON_ID=182087 /ORGANISM="Favella ehrenbergii, Strain Fehren 1" /LENGTH=88 /DNA_ID=CAMNT_0010736415 /DNA_START=97 /DNA_END=363 /DNA_ORIENTATION=+